MKIREFYARQARTFSFEFFPPKTDEGELKLFETIGQLKPLAPAFVTVTYGAMGTTRNNTLRIVTRIKKELGLEVAAHLTCVAHNRAEIEAILGDLAAEGIENIVALRGDIPQGEQAFRPPADGFRYASELVAFIRMHPRFSGLFSLAVAGYPEGHIECRDLAKDLANLKTKVDAGADVVVTQLFFHNRDFFRFLDRVRAAGIRVPVVPGIMPVTHGPQIEKFALMCGAAIPKEMREAIARFGEDQKSVEAYGIEYATQQCEELLRAGVPGIHFYTLNRSNATRRIYLNLGLPQAAR